MSPIFLIALGCAFSLKGIYLTEDASVACLQADHVDVAEQNVDDSVWPDGVSYSRRLPAKWLPTEGQGGGSGGAATFTFTISCPYDDDAVLGWMNLHLDEPVVLGGDEAAVTA